MGVIEESMALPSGFLDSLCEEDDWSFIIKMHAFLEAQLSTVIVDHLNKEELSSVITEMPMSHGKYGKARIARSLGIISKEMLTYINSLSALRNKLVHNIENVKFNINNEYEKKVKKAQEVQYNNFGFALKGSEYEEKNTQKIFNNSPKKAIHFSGIAIVQKLYLEKMEAKNSNLERESGSLALQILKQEESESVKAYPYT